MIAKLTLQKARLIIASILTLGAMANMLSAAGIDSLGGASGFIWASAAVLTVGALILWTLYLRGRKNLQPSGIE